MSARKVLYPCALAFLSLILACGDDTPSGPEAEPRLLWRAQIGERVASSPKLANGLVYVGGSEGYVHCLEAETGRDEWLYQCSRDITSDPCVADGKVFIVSDDSLLCLDAKDGRLLWTYRGTSRIGCNPVAAPGKLFFIHYGIITCLNADNGDRLWRAYNKREEDFYGTPCLYKGKLYVADMKHFFCFNAENGEPIWEAPLGDKYYPRSPCAENGKVFLSINGYDSEVFDLLKCYDASSGKLLWTYNFGYNRGISDAAAGYGKAYVNGGGADSRCTRCFDGSTGKLLWESRTGTTAQTKPCVANDKVFIGAEQETVVCVSAESGNRLWQYQIPRGNEIFDIRGQPAYADGRLFVDTDGLYIYCLKAD